MTTRCHQTDALLEATFAEAGPTRAQAAHAADCPTCARELAAARRFGIELHRASEAIVATAESGSNLREPHEGVRRGVTMRQLVAGVVILVVVVLAAAGYGGGRWIGSLVDVGFDQRASSLEADAADRAAERAGAQEPAARAEAEARARAEAVRRASDRRVFIVDPAVDAARGAWLQRVGDRCSDWVMMTAAEKVGTADMLTAEVVETVRIAQDLPESATHAEVLAGAAISIDTVCEGAPERELVEVTISLYGR